jgi:hypothetical protein
VLSRWEAGFYVVPMGFLAAAWALGGTGGQILWGIGGLILLIGLVRGQRAVREARAGLNATVENASDDELLTTWSALPQGNRGWLARRRREIERELQNRGLVPPEER